MGRPGKRERAEAFSLFSLLLPSVCRPLLRMLCANGPGWGTDPILFLSSCFQFGAESLRVRSVCCPNCRANLVPRALSYSDPVTERGRAGEDPGNKVAAELQRILGASCMTLGADFRYSTTKTFYRISYWYKRPKAGGRRVPAITYEKIEQKKNGKQKYSEMRWWANAGKLATDRYIPCVFVFSCCVVAVVHYTRFW